MKPYLRLIFISLISIVVLATAFTILRQMGLRAIVPVANHPWMKMHPWKVVEPAPCTVLKDKSEIAWIPLHLKNFEDWYWQCSDGKTMAIQDVLKAYGDQNVMFDLFGKDASGGIPLMDATKAWSESHHIAIISTSQNLLRKIRQQRPQWLFGGDSATWVKLKAFEPLYIETILDVWQDFFIGTETLDRYNTLDSRTVAELKRRKKILLVETTDGHPIADSSLYDGTLTKRPKTP